MDTIFERINNTAKALVALLLLTSFISSAHAVDKKRVYMSMDYKQVMDGHKVITVSLRARQEGNFINIAGVPVQIFMETPDGDTLLAEVNTNDEGIASLAIESGFPFVRDDEGEYVLKAVFEGNEIYKEEDKDVDAKDFILKADFAVIDSVKTITLEAYEIINDTSQAVPGEFDVEVYVDRLFQDLEVADTEIKEGKGQVTFPDGIPGDEEGNLKIRLVVDERDYGVVELEQQQAWGEPVDRKDEKMNNTATISYVVFMIISIIVVAILGLFFSRRVVNNKQEEL